jgi:hypothetical protein
LCRKENGRSGALTSKERASHELDREGREIIWFAWPPLLVFSPEQISAFLSLTTNAEKRQSN